MTERDYAFLIEQGRGRLVEPCTRERFYRTVGSQRVAADIRKFRALKEQAENAEKAGLAETATQKKQEAAAVKGALPGFVFQAYDFDESEHENKRTKVKTVGKYRLQHKAHCNGLYMIDVDHVAAPRELWARLCQEHDMRQLGVLTGFVTPSGQGLKMVAIADVQHGNLMSNQNWLAAQLGLTIDDSCKDASRLSFTPMQEDILYMDEERLFGYYSQAYDERYTAEYNEGKSQPDLFKPAAKGQHMSVDSATAQQPEEAAKDYGAYRYLGIEVPAIIDAWMEGKVMKEGVRHPTLISLASQLKYVCERNEHIVRYFLNRLPWVQDLRKENDNVDQSIEDGLKYRMFANMPKEMAQAVAKCQPAATADAGPLPEELMPFREWGEKIQAMFPDFPCLYEACYGLEVNSYPAVLFVSAAFFGTLMTRTWYHFYDKPEQERRLNYCVIVIGHPGSGKSFAGPLYHLICSPIIAADKLGTDAINKYKKELNERANSIKEQKKDALKYPDVQVRIHGPRTANGVLIEDMNACVDMVDGKPMHLHMLTFDSELDSATAASKGGQWIDKSVLELKAFHNEEDNQHYKNRDSVTGQFDVYWNFVYTGTPVSLARKVNERNFGTGLFSRLACVPICSKYFKMMKLSRQSKHNVQVEDKLKEWAYKLDRVKGELPLWPLVENCWEYVNAYMSLAELEGNKADAMLIRRVPYYGINIAAPFILMRHWDEWEQTGTFTVDKKDIELSTLVMDIQYYCQKMYFGKYAEMYFSDQLRNEEERRTSNRSPKTDAYFEALPESFSVKNLMKITGLEEGTCYVIINRWAKSGRVQKMSRKHGSLYQKL